MEIETNAWGLPELCTCTDVGHSPHQCSRCGAGVCEGCGKNDLSTCFKWTCKGSCKDFHHIKGGRTTNAAPSLFQILCNMRSQDEHILSPNSAALRVKGDENKTAAAKRSLGSQLESRYFASDITNESGASIDIGMEPDKSDAKVISRKKESLSQQKTQCDRSIFCNKKRRVMRANHGKHSNSNKTSIDFRHSIVVGASPDTKLCPPIVEKRNETELDWESAALFQMPKSPRRKQRQQQDQQRLKAPPFLSVRIPKNASDNQSCKMVGNTDNNAENLAKEFIRQSKYDQQNKLRFHQEIKRKDLHNDAVSARNNRNEPSVHYAVSSLRQPEAPVSPSPSHQQPMLWNVVRASDTLMLKERYERRDEQVSLTSYPAPTMRTTLNPSLDDRSRTSNAAANGRSSNRTSSTVSTILHKENDTRLISVPVRSTTTITTQVKSGRSIASVSSHFVSTSHTRLEATATASLSASGSGSTISKPVALASGRGGCHNNKKTALDSVVNLHKVRPAVRAAGVFSYPTSPPRANMSLNSEFTKIHYTNEVIAGYGSTHQVHNSLTRLHQQPLSLQYSSIPDECPIITGQMQLPFDAQCYFGAGSRDEHSLSTYRRYEEGRRVCTAPPLRKISQQTLGLNTWFHCPPENLLTPTAAEGDIYAQLYSDLHAIAIPLAASVLANQLVSSNGGSDSSQQQPLRLKKHACPVCQRRFTQRSNMIAHTRTHTGEKPYKCFVCQRAFAQKSNLKRHGKIHTRKKRKHRQRVEQRTTETTSLKIKNGVESEKADANREVISETSDISSSNMLSVSSTTPQSKSLL